MEAFSKRVDLGVFNNGFNSAPEEITISSQSQHPLNTKPVNSFISQESEESGCPISNFNSTRIAPGTHQNIPTGTIYSNLAVAPNGQINNYSPDLHDESLHRMQRLVTTVTYVVLLISGLIVLIGYAILLAKIASILDLIELGNWWMFLNIFLSSTITILLCGFAVRLTFWSKGQLGPKQVAWINIGLALWVIVPIFLGPIGISEYNTRRNRNTNTSQEITNFGFYVQAVCGNSTRDLKPGATTPPSVAIHINPDPVKCDAIRTLKTGIFFSFAWAIELLIAIIITATFGMRSPVPQP